MIVRLLVLLLVLFASTNLSAPRAAMGQHDVAHAQPDSKATLSATSSLLDTPGECEDDDDLLPPLSVWLRPSATAVGMAAEGDESRVTPHSVASCGDDARTRIRRLRGYVHLPRMDLVG